ncbi:hypothetical protein CYMTET_47821, partial [Cymbomonas tetramitiformis]
MRRTYKRSSTEGGVKRNRFDLRTAAAVSVLFVSSLNFGAVYFDVLASPHALTLDGDGLEQEESVPPKTGCSALEGDDRDACLEEREFREKERAKKAAKQREAEVALEVYKKQRRKEKKLKQAQQQAEFERVATQKERDTLARAEEHAISEKLRNDQEAEERDLEAMPGAKLMTQ